MASVELTLPFTAQASEGGVTVTDKVIAKIAGKCAQSTYGIVGMQAGPIRRLARPFRGSLDEGVQVDVQEGRVNLGLHVVMERGVNLAQVTANLQEQVRYQLGRVAGLPLGEISVRVEDLKD